MNIANKVTTVRMILVPVFVVLYLIFGRMYNVAAILYAVASLTDALDGHLARSRNLVTTFGKFMDPLVDKILTMAGFVLLTSTNIIPSWAVILIISRELIITGLIVIAIGTVTGYLLEKSGAVETMAQTILKITSGSGYIIFPLDLLILSLSNKIQP